MPEHPGFVRPDILDRWLVRGAIAVVVTLQFSLINDFSFGTRWLAPTLEIILLVPLTALTLRAEGIAWHGATGISGAVLPSEAAFRQERADRAARIRY
jgi:hypothetical protein